MAENEKQPVAESHQKIDINVKKRSLTRKQSTDRNYKTLHSGKTILERNFGKVKTMIIRNYRKLGL